VLSKIEQANADGLVMRGQVAPRPIGVLMGLTTTICPFSTRKAYKEIAHLPVAERINAMREPVRRDAILRDKPTRGFAVMHQKMDEGHMLASSAMPVSSPRCLRTGAVTATGALLRRG